MAVLVSAAEPHNFQKSECRKCHVEPKSHPKALKAGVSRLCVPCHIETVRASSHPVNVVPVKAKVPDEFPLRKGKLTCVTCHDVHSAGNSVYRTSSPPSKDFCSACHKRDRSRASHSDVISLAHMGARFKGTDAGEPLDRLSVACFGCHQAMFSLPGDSAEAVAMMKPHIMGINYRAARGRPGSRLAPLNALDPAIQFFEGRIGCGTCHNMYSLLPKKLVMRNLCTECHRDAKSHWHGTL
jgi:predicted CXXCH cytochrome family protein